MSKPDQIGVAARAKAAQRVEQVVAKHFLGYWVVEKGYECLGECGWFGERHDHPAHVAAAVVAALGLTEETRSEYLGVGRWSRHCTPWVAVDGSTP